MNIRFFYDYARSFAGSASDIFLLELVPVVRGNIRRPVRNRQPSVVFGNFPKAEVQFMCLSAGDAELARPKLKPKADVSVKVKQGM